MAVPYPPEEKERLLCAVADRMRTGQSMRKACEAENVPNSTIMTWVNDQSNAGASERYARARDALLSFRMNEIVDLADGLVRLPSEELTPERIQATKVQIDARKWEFAKLLPNICGDKVQTTLSAPGGGPLELVYVMPAALPAPAGYDTGEG